MNRKIKCLVGISASGKSTWSHQEWLKDPLNTIVISRDKVRNLLWNYTDEDVHEYYKRTDFNKLEKEITKYCDSLIYEAIEGNKTIILDNTNLDLKNLKALEFWNIPVEYIYFDIAIKEAINRDSNRTRKVGVEIIKKQFDKYQKLERVSNFEPIEFLNNGNLEPCFLIDIDGTLAHMSGRSPYEWNKVGEDYVDVDVKHATNSIFASHKAKIFICTGRDGVCLKETIEWLDEHDICYDKIFIRKEGDMRPDWVVKEEMWRQIAKDNYISALIDDRMQVVRRARSLGLKVLQVEYNNF